MKIIKQIQGLAQLLPLCPTDLEKFKKIAGKLH
jgi:hypothetical protein